jgi:hypothetical protein
LDTQVSDSHSSDESEGALSPVPIFILGIRPRSGTHFLANLLCQHPDCVKSPIAEDSLLLSAHLLNRYVSRVNEQWTAGNGEPLAGYDELLRQCIGDGLVSFLRETQIRGAEERVRKFGKDAAAIRTDKRLVTKTPLIDNLEHFFEFFPRAHLLVLVRDGRAVVESNVRSFATDSESEMRAWAAAADKLAQFESDYQNARARYLVVRFEDLHSRTEAEMRRILAFLGLSSETYPFEHALDLPVVGSSTFKRPPGNVRWLPVKKTTDFDPLARASEWTRASHERFNWVAGPQLVHLGYTPTLNGRNNLAWKIWNQGMDLKWSTAQVLKRLLPRFGVRNGDSTTTPGPARRLSREQVAPGAG